MTSSAPHRGDRSAVRPWPDLVAGGICAVHAVALVGLGVFYVWEVVRGEQDSVARAATSAVLIVVVALGLGLLARGWLRRASWARTPTMVWDALLLPVGWSLVQSGHPTIGVVVGGTALLGLVAAWQSPVAERS